MSVFIIRRLIQAVLVVVAMSMLVFTGVFLIGDPVEFNQFPDQGTIIAQAIEDLAVAEQH